MVIDVTANQSVLVMILLAGFGGLIGGALTGRRASLVGSTLIGAIGGLVATVLARALDLPPLMAAGEFSLVYALVGGFLFAVAVGFSTR